MALLHAARALGARTEFRLKNATEAAEDDRTCGVEQLARVLADAGRYQHRQDRNQTLLLTGINLHAECGAADLFVGLSNRLDGSPDLTFKVTVHTLDSALENAASSNVSLVVATEQEDNVLLKAQQRLGSDGRKRQQR